MVRAWDMKTLEDAAMNPHDSILCYFSVELLDKSIVYLIETRSIYRPYALTKWLKEEDAQEIVLDCDDGTYTSGRNVVEKIDEWWAFDDVGLWDFARPYFQEFCSALSTRRNSGVVLSNTQPRSSLPEYEAPVVATSRDRSKPEFYETLDNTPFYWRVK